MFVTENGHDAPMSAAVIRHTKSAASIVARPSSHARSGSHSCSKNGEEKGSASLGFKKLPDVAKHLELLERNFSFEEKKWRS